MTDTLQPLPSWMTYSSDIFTEPDGVLTTSYTILQLPLTYYGPSIPLGPDWVYGGLSSPASTTAPATTEPTTTPATTTPATTTPFTTSSLTPSATPTTISSTTAIPTSTSLTSVIPTTIPSTITAIPSSSTSPITSSPSSSSTTLSTSAASTSSAGGPLPTGVPSATGGLSHNSIVAIICGSIAGFLILLVLLVLCCILARRHRRRRAENTPFTAPQPAFFMRGVPVTLSSIGSSYILIGSERTARPAGEGSPRHSGEEADPFLQASTARRRAFADDRSSGSSAPAKASVWAIGPDGQRIHIRNSDGSEAEHGDPSELDHDAYTDMDTTVVDDEAGRFRAFASADQERVKVAAAGQILSPGAAAAYAAAGQDPKMMLEKAENVDLNEKMPLVPAQSYGGPDALGLSLLGLPEAQSSASHLLPPRSTTPYRTATRVSNDSGVSLADRYSPATFMFAHRVQVADPRVPPAGSPPELRSALLGEPARTPEPESAVTPRSQHWLSPLTSSFNSFGLGGLGWLRREPSALGRPLEGAWLSRVPTPGRSREESDDEETGLLAPRAESPPMVPSATARSRGQLSVPSSSDRPISSISHRSKTSTVYHSASESLQGDRASSGASAQVSIPVVPALPAAAARSGRQSPPASAFHTADLLDLPIPAAVPSFVSSSARRRPPPLQLPPGLHQGIPAPRVWTDTHTSSPEHTPLSPIASVSDASSDMLDAAPPRAADVWRSLADARERGVRAPGVIPTVVHQVARQESYNVSVHGSSLSGSSGRVSFAGAHPPLSAMGSTAPLLPRPRDSTAPLLPRLRDSTLTHQSSGTSLAPRSSGASSPASWQDRGFEGAASLSAFGPPQPGVFMSRNPYAPLSRPSGLASGSTIRVVGPTPPGSEESG